MMQRKQEMVGYVLVDLTYLVPQIISKVVSNKNLLPLNLKYDSHFKNVEIAKVIVVKTEWRDE